VTTSTRIAETFSALKAAGHLAFMPFITAGDPDVETTGKLIEELGQKGVDLIEVGFPYSDPIADGPVIQASYTRALKAGVRVENIFAGVNLLATEDLPPLVAMVSYGIIFRYGVEAFVERAESAGFAGFIIPDLPADEGDDVGHIIRAGGLDLIQLVSPMTPQNRAVKILQSASGFVYCISVAGTTGVRDSLPEELTAQLAWLRSQTELPLAVGFGISRPDQVNALRTSADGVIVGSAFVQCLESEDTDLILTRVGELAEAMVAAAHAG